MSDDSTGSDPIDQHPDLVAYRDDAGRAIARVFDAARDREELQYAMALNVEFRGIQLTTEITAYETFRAVEDFTGIMEQLPDGSARVRLGLALYSHIWEAAGMFETPKNMLNIAAGQDYGLWPFQADVRGPPDARRVIPPNANRTMRELLTGARALGFDDFADCLLDGFDGDLRNGYAHADYVLWPDGIYLRMRHGGTSRLVPYPEFTERLNRTLIFFEQLRITIHNRVDAYAVPKTVIGRMNGRDPMMKATIHFDEDNGTFSISGSTMPA